MNILNKFYNINHIIKMYKLELLQEENRKVE